MAEPFRSHINTSSRQTCRFFNTHRGCFEGPKCRFLHVQVPSNSGGGEDGQPNESITTAVLNGQKVAPPVFSQTSPLKRRKTPPPPYEPQKGPDINPTSDEPHAIEEPMIDSENSEFPATASSNATRKQRARWAKYQSRKRKRMVQNREAIEQLASEHRLREVPLEVQSGPVKLRYELWPFNKKQRHDALVSKDAMTSESNHTSQDTHAISDTGTSASTLQIPENQPLDVLHGSPLQANSIKVEVAEPSLAPEREELIALDLNLDEMDLLYPPMDDCEIDVKPSIESTLPVNDKGWTMELTPRHLRTSGTIYFGQPPDKCDAFSEMRRIWAYNEAQQLTDKGLFVHRIIMRDDGMAIDWTSSTPVWSDTLLPEESLGQERRERELIPYRALPHRVVDFTPLLSPISVMDARIFLHRYFRGFKEQRHQLKEAYLNEATFSLQLHRSDTSAKALASFECIVASIPSLSKLPSNRNVFSIRSNRESIGSFLISLGPFAHQASQSVSSTQQYGDLDVALLGEDAAIIITHGRLLGGACDSSLPPRILSFSHSFLLARYNGLDCCWPFAIKCHQMTIRPVEIGSNTDV